MAAFFSWYFLVTLLGWLTFPLAYHLFPALADRGYTLARALGLLVWGYLFWLLVSLGVLRNDVIGLLFGLLLLVGLSTWAFLSGDRRSEIASWLRGHLGLVGTVEVLFLLAFAFLAFIRAGNPELNNAEKPMELMFINAILRSPTFPPHDSWLSGYAISYYYFGYVMTAMLAKLTGLSGSIAHNLMTALIFGLSSIGAYGILYNLLASVNSQSKSENQKLSIGLPLLGPLFLLLVSNLEGFLEVLHRRGILWPAGQIPNLQSSSCSSLPLNFWTWLNIKELNQPPSQPLGWIPDRFWWWWRTSRVVQDFDLACNFREVIDEFPFFSFLHADLHPHVLAIPFNLLAMAAALNLFLGGWRGETNLFGLRLQISKTGFFFAALTLGGLAFLNTWDILVAAALIVLAYLLLRTHQGGWKWARLEDLFALGLPLGVLAVFLYLPFYVGFSSQAGGVLPNLINPTRGAQLWVMFAPLFILLLVYLIYLWRGERHPANWFTGPGVAVGIVVALWLVFNLLPVMMGNLAFRIVAMPAEGWFEIALVRIFTPIARTSTELLQSQGMTDIWALFEKANLRRLAYIGGLVTLLAILAPTLAFLFSAANRWGGSEDRPSVFPFVLLLITLGTLLVIAPEFVYLRDQFGTRMNTIFKFYYQAWLLWSLAAAFGTAILLHRLRGAPDRAFRIGLAILLFMALTYPLLSIANKTNNFKPPFGWTLDDFAHIRRENPDEAAAIEWLDTAPDGVVAEAVGGSYTGFARISTYTGLPTVLGWPGHESQWRGGSAEQGARQEDIQTLYTTSSWEAAQEILRKYKIRYVYIGSLERTTYLVQEDKFHRFLRPVFQQGIVMIYEVPDLK